MSCKLIGELLDAAVGSAGLRARSALGCLKNTDQGDLSSGLSVREAAQRVLANELLCSQLPPVPIDWDNDDEEDLYRFAWRQPPSYRELVRSMFTSDKQPQPLKQFHEDAAPDLVLRDRQERLSMVLEVSYGYEPAFALAAVDRLLHFSWATTNLLSGSGPTPTVAYIFLHELRSGEIIRKTERAIDDWIGEHYGPFKGIDRFHTPMMPRLTRSGTKSSHGPGLSLLEPSKPVPGYTAFCVSFDYDGW
jgi:hypothetical protein